MGARCVEAEKPTLICQNPAESHCSRHSDCPGSEVCGIDGRCRDACATTRDCPKEQTCAAGTCADSTDLVDGELPRGVDAGSGVVCVHSADCPLDLVCLGPRVCGVECITDKDCFISWHCDPKNARCTPPVDAGPDSMMADAAPEAIADAGPDGADAGHDGADAGHDTGIPDAGPDAADAGHDATIADAGPDAADAADAGTDATDAAQDAGVDAQGPTCSDSLKNGTETDVDCGGNSCGPCALGKACARGSDCITGICTTKSSGVGGR